MKTKRIPATRKSRKQDMIDAMGNISRGEVYLGDEITIVDKTWNCKGQGGCKK